jgi:hypothetical protein
VFDEPEAHLHPRSIATIVAAIEAIRDDSDVIVATHSARFLQRPRWNHYRLTRSNGRTQISRYDARDRPKVDQVARELGITAGELLVNTSALLFVEGLHDQMMLEAFFAEDLDAAAVQIIPLRGTKNVMSVATMELAANLFTDLVVGIMVDNVRWSAIQGSSRDRTSEERVIADFLAEMEAQNRPVRLVLLQEPDVVAYLAEPALRRRFPNFSSWECIVREYRTQGARDFKNWLTDQPNLRIRLRTAREIQPIIDDMAAAGDRPGPGLVRAVKEFCAFVSDSTHANDE